MHFPAALVGMSHPLSAGISLHTYWGLPMHFLHAFSCSPDGAIPCAIRMYLPEALRGDSMNLSLWLSSLISPSIYYSSEGNSPRFF
jgi:hypothetical protein